MILADIYAARETDTLGISSKDLADAIAEKGADVYYFPSFEEIENFCREHCQKGDVLITMGAGDHIFHRILSTKNLIFGLKISFLPGQLML